MDDPTKPRPFTIWTLLQVVAGVSLAIVTLPIWGVPLFMALRNNPD